jgi:cobalamin biosynthetic protein CobC
MLEHGGNLRTARSLFGGDHWIDLSTGINPHGYPALQLPADAWHRLPESDPALLDAACAFYRAPALLAVAGTQAAIQALPRLRAPCRVTVSAPSYAEHAHQWAGHGHTVTQTTYCDLDAAVAHSDVMVICNPNNPTGAIVPAARLLEWAAVLATRGGWLVVDEAFGDTAPQHSIAPHSDRAGVIVLRSVGKFFGLAGLRLGFVGASPAILKELGDALGPWPVSGPAQHIARSALGDHAWHSATFTRLNASSSRLQQLLAQHGIQSSGTALFQWWPEPHPQAFWRHMAERGIWVRLFEHAARGIRLGLPNDQAAWQRLHTALDEWTHR